MKAKPTTNLQHTQIEVVCAEDAAVAQAAGLAAGGELDEPGGEGAGAVGWHINGEGDTLFSTDDVAIGGSNIPYLERDALDDLLDGEAAAPVGHAGLDDARALCHAPKF